MGTKYKGTNAEVRALNTYIKLTRASETVFDWTNSHLDKFNVSTSQFAVLEALYHLGPMTQIEVARKLLKSTGNITTVLQNLEKRRLIRRQRDPKDQRYIVVSITNAGRQLVGHILPRHVSRIVSAMSALSAEEQMMLAKLCRKLGHRLMRP